MYKFFFSSNKKQISPSLFGNFLMSRIVRYFSDSDQMSYPCLKWNKEGKVCAMEMGTKNITDKIDIEY